MTRFLRLTILGAFFLALFAWNAPQTFAQEHEMPAQSGEDTHSKKAVDSAVGADHGGGAGHGGEAHGGPKAVFDPEHGTWFNGIARSVAPGLNSALGIKTDASGPHGPAVKYDFLIVTPILWALLAITLVSAARKIKIRP